MATPVQFRDAEFPQADGVPVPIFAKRLGCCFRFAGFFSWRIADPACNRRAGPSRMKKVYLVIAGGTLLQQPEIRPRDGALRKDGHGCFFGRRRKPSHRSAGGGRGRSAGFVEHPVPDYGSITGIMGQHRSFPLDILPKPPYPQVECLPIQAPTRSICCKAPWTC